MPTYPSRASMLATIKEQKALLKVHARGEAIPMADLIRYEYGYLAEDFAQYRLKRNGFSVFRPTYFGM